MFLDSSKAFSTDTAVWRAMKISIGFSLEKGPTAFSDEHIIPWMFESDCQEPKWDTTNKALFSQRLQKSLPSLFKGLTIYHEATNSYIKASATSH